jgi:hypothetical protein
VGRNLPSLRKLGYAAPISVTVRSNVLVCGCWIPGIAGSNSAKGMDVYLVCLCVAASAKS